MISEYTLESWAIALDQAYHQEKDLWITLQVLADWLEERDQEGDSARSACLRWCAKYGKKPDKDKSMFSYDHDNSYDWVNERLAGNTDGKYDHASVPCVPQLGNYLNNGREPERMKDFSYREYPTPSAAYFALCEAWVLLGKDAPV